MKEPMVITMAREYASGGSEIAQAVADKLGIPLYNKELITLAAKKSGLTEEAIAASENQRSGSLIYSLYMMGNTMPLADQVYIYEKEGFGSDFYITLNSDGSMRCSEGALSSYFGLGTWKLDGDTVILTTDDEKFVNRFAVEDGTLVYQSADSTGFMYLTVSDGEKFLPSGAPVGSLDIDEG